MRDAHLPELIQPEVFPSNVASAGTAIRPYLRTIDATTAFVADAGSHVISINLKLVNAAGVAVRGVVDVSAFITGTTIVNDGFAATTGTLQSNNNLAPSTVAWTMKILAATTGIIAATLTLTGAGTASIVIQYGNQQIVVPALTVA